MPITLAIETSQRTGGVALRDRDGVVHVEAIDSTKRHDDDLMPAIDRVVKVAGLAPRDLGAAGVSIGPGGFTGLRLAVTTAKLLAETLGVAIVAVPSALVAAASLAETLEGSILIALAGKRETAWVTRVCRDGEGWEIRDEPSLVESTNLPLDGIAAMIADRYLPEAMGEHCRAAGIPVLEPKFDPASVLAIAEAMLADGKTTDPLSLVPFYPRPPEAVSLWASRPK